ncbi:MAG: glycoside hydrolase family 3 C-terminal domain-containing protein [Actinomycetota bacterium]|nr:glycoside hydrolase family 3 C-terminal domain-containing protein [Actinomycetota bacterium]
MSDERIEALVASLTTAEKASLTAGDDVWHLPAVGRLGIGRLKVSDGPSGVRGERIGTRRSLSFPCGMAAGATWDADLMQRYGVALAQEARAKGVHVLLGPTVCIPRTPLAGRTFESFAEDPFLSARLTVAYVRGVQGEGVGCCVKHFACNDQEHERMTISAQVDERTLREIHLPSFEAAVREAGVWSIMSAYNKLNGTYCGEHPSLLGTVLKREWDFDGVVISDWFGTHSTTEAAIAGLDVEMPGPPQHLGARLAAAVDAGEVGAEVLDDHARRILRLADRTGLLAHEPADGEPQDAEDIGRRRLAREVAIAGTVLLRNEALLPLDASARRVAVIGPNADVLETGGGGSSQVVPHRVVSFVDELSARLADVEVVHEEGCRLDRGVPLIDARLLGDGLRVQYFANPAFDGDPAGEDTLGTGNFVALGDPMPGVPVRSCSLRARGTFRPDVSGTWQLGIANAGKARLLLDGDVIVDNTDPTPGSFFYGMGSETVAAPLDLEAGRDHDLVVEMRCERLPIAGFRVVAARPEVLDAMERAVSAAATADVAIVIVGSNSQWETEGSDRSDLHLVGEQEELIRRVLEANPRTVVVINAGAPVETRWATDAAALVMAWYPGEEGAAALADILTGVAEPGGRLPITFPERLEDSATHDWYPGSGGRVLYGEGVLVGYRHFDTNDVEPAYCFGHGLSYTSFDYGAPMAEIEDGQGTVTVPVTNSGNRRGGEVVQLYVADLEASVARPRKELKAFAKVELDAGESRSVRLALDRRSFAFWDEASHDWVVEPGDFELHIGSSSRHIRHRLRVRL